MDHGTTSSKRQQEQDIIEKYDVIQMSLSPVSGVDRHVMVTAAGLNDILHNKGSLNFGQSACLDSVIFDEVSSCGSASVDMSSLRPLPWLSSEDCRVGGAMCHVTPPTKTRPSASPRAAALEQIATLKQEFGLEIQSAFEMEFMVYERDGGLPFNNKANSFYGRIDSWAGREDVFFNICQSLLSAGLPVETLLTEMAAGQFEITFAPQRGVASSDSVIITKAGLRKCLAKADLIPTFMSTPDEKEHSNGFHFNHSLLKINHRDPGIQGVSNEDVHDIKENSKLDETINVFCDPEDPLMLSSIARHWLAGLIEHGPGLALLSSPTFNCARRLQDSTTPKGANWGIENRKGFLRVRNSKANVYIENRLPSSASNPYLVLAGVLAAGMDGMRRQLVCPPQMDQAAPPLPVTLEEAVCCLERDTVLKEALGQELISSFLSLTRKAINLKESRSLEDLEKQKELYFSCI